MILFCIIFTVQILFLAPVIAKLNDLLFLDYSFVDPKAVQNDSGALSGLWFAGLIVGFILCGVVYFVYRKYGHRMG